MKKLLALFALMLVCIGQAFAYSFEVDGIYYDMSGKNAIVTYKTTSNNSYSGDVEIPATVTYNGTTYSVTSIGSSAFCYCSSLTSVTIPNSVQSIGSDAFYNCSSLTNVYISDVAAWCKISNLNFLMQYGSYSKTLYLNGEAVEDLVIPEGLTSITGSAFRDCKNIKTVTIPNSVESIGSYAFYDSI